MGESALTWWGGGGYKNIGDMAKTELYLSQETRKMCISPQCHTVPTNTEPPLCYGLPHPELNWTYHLKNRTNKKKYTTAWCFKLSEEKKKIFFLGRMLKKWSIWKKDVKDLEPGGPQLGWTVHETGHSQETGLLIGWEDLEWGVQGKSSGAGDFREQTGPRTERQKPNGEVTQLKHWPETG